jgi:chitin disaccharide deacetylase
MLILNADDWGRDRHTTDRIFECAKGGTVSSVSGMVFMDDSERAATLALERKTDAGLHLNLTTPFTAATVPAQLAARQQDVARFLNRHRLAHAMFHPGLMRSFEYVVSAQLDEFQRLYGRAPDRVDGHHHMHLCANVVLGGLLPAGTLVRRNFSFASGEKSLPNRLYRRAVDGLLARRHRLVDFFFSLVPIEVPGRLPRIISLASRHAVEVETHPALTNEYQFLTGGEIFRLYGAVEIAPSYVRRAVRRPDEP